MVEKIADVLLVEDDTLDIINVERTFKKMSINHKLHVARNGEEAINILKGNGVEKIKPSLVMLDINMPKMNGIEFLSIIRKDEELKNLKVFIMTTSSHQVDKNAAKELGISGYIIKPLNFKNAASSMDSFSLMIDLLNLKK